MRTRYLPIVRAFDAGLSLGQTVVDKHPIPFGSVVLTFEAASARVNGLSGPRTAHESRGASSRRSATGKPREETEPERGAAD